MSLAEFIYTQVLKPRPLRVLTNTVLLKMIPQSKQVGRARIVLDPDDPVVSSAVAFGVYELEELEFFETYCKGNMVLMDIGANLGVYTSVALHNLGEGGHIVAIEPRPQTFAVLERNIAENRRESGPRVDAFMIAAASDEGVRLLFENPENRADNRLYDSSDRHWNSVKVPSRRLDDLLCELGMETVDFVKIDVQGYEQHVVRGFRQTLAHSQDVILMTEFWPQGLREAQSDPAAYLEELEDIGFELYELKERARGKLVALNDANNLIQRLSGSKYTNLIGLKGKTPVSLEVDKGKEVAARTAQITSP